jgi:uridylate kinase
METVVISLGGSIAFPEEINLKFLDEFRNLIIRHKSFRFIIIVGGGFIARHYQRFGSKLELSNESLDWIGIKATLLNAEFLKQILLKETKEVFGVITDPFVEIPNKRIIIGGGFKPGSSTDLRAVQLAKRFNSSVINISNIDYVYDSNPKQNSNAKPFKEMLWKDFRKMNNQKWSAGLSLPFDPVAAEKAEKENIKAIICGPSIRNIEKIILREDFKGTIIKN